MPNGDLIGKVHASVYHQCQARGYATAVDVLMDIGVLTKQKYKDWLFGRVSYLETVCSVNLSKLSFILHQISVYAKKTGLNPSVCYYKRWGMKKKGGQGAKPVLPLRFSKTGDPAVEKSYATHYVDSKRIAAMKLKSIQDNAQNNAAADAQEGADMIDGAQQ